MNKELIDRIWKILPAEFKEEVKKKYKYAYAHYSLYVQRGAADTLEQLFGHHNLTSDAEGEEMLCVSRKQVLEMYSVFEKFKDKDDTCFNLATLFGSKCLPDACNVASPSQKSPENCDTEKHISTDCDKPAEPKFKRCEKVITPSGEVCIIEDTHFENGRWLYLIGEPAEWISESNLEPYNELGKKHHVSVKEACEILGVDESEATKLVKSKPKNEYSERLRAESVKESRIASEESHLRNLSQETANCDKHFDNILKDSFAKERRLNIAAMIMASMMQNTRWGDKYSHIANMACAAADALIAEAEEGGVK